MLVFPEGARGFVKPYRKAYRLQRFGLGFMRLALEHHVPILPVGVVGSEEQSPGLADVKWLGRLIGSPAFPITVTMPWLGPLGFIPLPVKFHLSFGSLMRFEGAFDAEDADLQPKVDQVKKEILRLIQMGLSRRKELVFLRTTAVLEDFTSECSVGRDRLVGECGRRYRRSARRASGGVLGLLSGDYPKELRASFG